MKPKKKINTKKKSNILASSVKSDPISTTIVKEEKQPNQDILQNWVPFFQDSDNIYVNDLAKRARRSSTHGSIINQAVTFAVGQEFTYTVNGESKELSELPKEFQEWVDTVNPEGDSLRDVFFDLMQSYVITGNCYPHVKKAGGKVALYNEDSTTVRKSKDKKRAYISNFWRDIQNNATPTSQYPINDKLTFWNGTPKNEYLVHVMRKFPEFNYYGLPSYVGCLNWADIEYRMAKYNIDKFDNGFFPSVLMQMFGEVPDGMTAEEYVTKIRNKFTGESNNDKVMIELLDSPESAAIIHEFDRERDGEFMELGTQAQDAIVAGHRFGKALAGFAISGQLGDNNQLKEQYEAYMNKVSTPDFQTPLLKELNRIIKRETSFGDIEIGILNLSIVGNSDDIDINAITTVNEGRAIVGLKPLEDNRGELFINNNSVENIETTEEKPEE